LLAATPICLRRQPLPVVETFVRTDVKVRVLRATTSAMVLAAVLAVLPVPASAATTPKSYSYRVSGAEVYATTTVGRFAGTASGNGATGTWYAQVNHESLVGVSTAAITGGSFRMALNKATPAYTVEGQFAGGSIVKTQPGTNCTNQVYAVHGKLSNVSVTRAGSFDVTLTHYRTRILGLCRTYSATVTGTLSLGPTSLG
jgi:hypothetical protein